MSVRLLRRVLKEQQEGRSVASDLHPELAGAAASAEDDDEEEEHEPSAIGAPSRNPFDLLDDQEDENEVAVQDQQDYVIEQKDVSKKPTNGNQISSRKSKKKKKKIKEVPSSATSKPEKSLDAILEDLSISPNPSNDQIVQNAKANKKNVKMSILATDPKFLKAENELRRIFGSKVVNSFENQHSSRQMYGGRHIGHNPRKTILVSPLSVWPKWDNSMTMELLETKNGLHYFRYVHSPSYSYAQEAFEVAKAANDLDAIAMILHHHPYHIESWLTFADLYKYSGELQASSNAVVKCLYAMECAWHPLFSPLQGNCQLKYNHDVNKPLFVALFNHMKNMDRRGCHRSALEVCKLLLSLDHDDPTGALFCIDYFSLRAQEYGWLEQFVEEYRPDSSLWLFPNFSYSLAIAHFYLERDSVPKVLTEKATSSDFMKQALMLHPLVLQKLVAKTPLKDPAWTQILKCSFFSNAKAGSPSLEHLINIYVERSYIVWRYPELQKLLKEAAFRVIESIKDECSEAKDWRCVREEAFSFEKNEYSHLVVSDFSDAVPSIPPEELRQFMIGPQVVHEMQGGDREANPQRMHGPRELAGRNAAIVFLESLHPWVDHGRAGNEQGGDDHDAQNID